MSSTPPGATLVRDLPDDPTVARAPDATRLAIRGRPRAPLAIFDLARWLARLVDELRDVSPQLEPRLSRLTHASGGDSFDQGWLLELELPSEHRRHGSQRVIDALTDMRLLGLEATLLARHELSQPEAHLRDSATPPTEG